MAVRYAVATGNWSNTATWNGGTLPTSADDVYSNGFTVTIDQNVTVLSLRNTSGTGITAAGGFIVTGSFTITADFYFAGGNLLTYNGTGTLNIIGNIPVHVQEGGGSNCWNFTGSGNITVIGNINTAKSAGRSSINKTGSGKLTMTGNISLESNLNHNAITISAGDVEITGNITNSATVAGNTNVILHSGTGSLVVIGQLVNNSTANGTPNIVVSSTTSLYFKHIGSMINTSIIGNCVSIINYTSIVICTGPFISSSSAMLPFVCYRMNYQKTIGSYFELRDSSTNGALPPAASAPAARLVSPDTVVDAPIPANVRNGVTYALATLTGTLNVPSPDSVAKGVPTDNTVGNAVLTPDAVWNYATANLTDANSIGARLKNVSTVETTGEQLEALL
jgi:hypothetical protein